MQELIETEKAYYQDIQLIHDIYMCPKTESPFTEHEQKLLFGNITAILDLEKELVPLLCNDGSNIGQVFMQMVIMKTSMHHGFIGNRSLIKLPFLLIDG